MVLVNHRIDVIFEILEVAITMSFQLLLSTN